MPCALPIRSEEHTSELQSPCNLVCRLLLEKNDVNRIYMTFVQASTGAGGWPMSVFLTPSLQPFFGVFLMTRRPPRSPLFPYPTLFRSLRDRRRPCRSGRRSGRAPPRPGCDSGRSEEHTSELQSPCNLVCRLLLETN